MHNYWLFNILIHRLVNYVLYEFLALHFNLIGEGVGRDLIAALKVERNIDFLSVSFGYSSELVSFWHKCGFSVFE